MVNPPSFRSTFSEFMACAMNYTENWNRGHPLENRKATGNHSKAENHGKLGQIHTPAYKIEDATRLLYRKTYPGNLSGLPRDLRPPTPPPPPMETQAALNDCATPTCTTNSGIRTKGNAVHPHAQLEILALRPGMFYIFCIMCLIRCL